MVKKVKQFMQPEPKTEKEVVINAEPLETRVAVVEDGKLAVSAAVAVAKATPSSAATMICSTSSST